MTSATGVRIGIDLGGTKTRFVRVDAAGRVVAQAGRATAEYGSGDAALDALAADVRDLAGAGADFVGVGASGPVLPDGVIDNPDTLPGFSGIGVSTGLFERLGVPCRVDNDALAAAVGEWTCGAGQDARRLLVVTLGTGIGVGVVTAGSPYTGSDGVNPEGGHVPVEGSGHPCYCGLANCWEQVASRTALQRLAMAAVPAEVAAAGPQRAVAHLAAEPHPEVFTEYGRRVGLGLATLLTVHRPDVVVLGGSAAERFELLEPGLRTGIAGRPPAYYAPFTLRRAVLGDLSGAIGAACLPPTTTH
jgi:glucokinase